MMTMIITNYADYYYYDNGDDWGLFRICLLDLVGERAGKRPSFLDEATEDPKRSQYLVFANPNTGGR